MDDLTQHRKKRLEQLIAAAPFHGDRAHFMRKAGLSKGRISQLLDPAESFGERAAESLAIKLGLPDPRWFDKGAPGSPAVWPFVLVTQEQIQQLTPAHLEMLQKFSLFLLGSQSTPIASHSAQTDTESSNSRKGKFIQPVTDRNSGGKSDSDQNEAKRSAGGG